MKKLKDPTYEQLKEGAKKNLTVSYTVTTEVVERTLSVNGVHDMVFAKNDLGQSNVIAAVGELRPEVSNVVIHDWPEDKPKEDKMPEDMKMEEWFAHLCVLRQRAKEAISEQYDEYEERYVATMEDFEHSLRRTCNRLRRIAIDKARRTRAEVSDET